MLRVVLGYSVTIFNIILISVCVGIILQLCNSSPSCALLVSVDLEQVIAPWSLLTTEGVSEGPHSPLQYHHAWKDLS